MRNSPVFTTTLAFLALVFVWTPKGTAASIALEDFSLSAGKIVPGESFDVSARVEAVDLPRFSFVLRTTEKLPREKTPPALDIYKSERGLAYLGEEGDVNLSDNGPHDLDTRKGWFKVRLSTKGWQPGRYELALFAHNRPGGGLHIVDQHAFVVTVAPGKVILEDTGRVERPSFTDCGLSAWETDPGAPVELGLTVTGEISGVEIRQPYYMAKEKVPPSFFYDTEKHISSFRDEGQPLIRNGGPLDLDADPGRMRIRFDTTGWKPGLYFLELSLISSETGQADKRNLAFKVRDSKDVFNIEVSKNWVLCPGTHSERMARLSDGTLLYTSYLSEDNGTTWTKRDTGTLGPGPLALKDGRIVGMGYRTKPVEDRKGWYRGDGYVSQDGGRTVESREVLFHVPLAKAAHGHAVHPGPLYMRSMVERADGTLVALMAGWFLGDDVPCPYSLRRPYSRTYTCVSEDGGATWQYQSTIGYGQIGSEGYNEGSMKQLPNGDLVAVMRTGSMKDPRCHDNPIMVSRSRDGGTTWTTPRRTGAHGAFPDLYVMTDGVLALSYGRPGACIMFSTDGGETWGDQTIVDATPYSGYTTIVETAPGELLMAFGTKEYMDPKKGKQPNALRLARVQYTAKTASAGQKAMGLLHACGAQVDSLGDGFFEVETYSKALRRPERSLIHVPAGYDPFRREAYPFIVFLHGLGRHHRTLYEAPKTREVIQSCEAVVLFPNGKASWWVDSPVGTRSHYQSHLHELIETMTGALNVSAEPARRAIGGWSMGGFGSANYVTSHPEDFGAWGGIVALLDFPSPAYAAEDNHSVPAILGETADWAKVNPLGSIAAFKGKRISFISASEAFERKMNETFAARLSKKKIPHSFKLLEGAHTFEVVEQAFPEIMDFFAAGF